MSHARIEEVSDSESDPSEGNISDLDDFDERDILRSKGPSAPPIHDPDRILPPQLSSATKQHAPAIPEASRAPPAARPGGADRAVDLHRMRNEARGPQIDADGTQFQHTVDDSEYKDFQCIYPVYFDKNRSRAEGRRIGKELAVENPLAREIVTACGRLRLQTLFEPAKFHPKDWSNPGRVKVKVKGASNTHVKNKHHLYLLIAEHLRSNPTTTQSAMRVKVPGAPAPDMSKPYPEPSIPRGWKMGSILPYYSPAMTGGGVSDNFFGDMMKEMGGQLPPGMEGMANAINAPAPPQQSDKVKKPKRKIIRA